jgi:phosphate:Na+ symporter
MRNIMDIFDLLTLLGGLSLFLFGMNIMGQALERRAGSGLRSLLGRFTTNRLAGLLTGMGITAIIQSSSATTVMVVGFVNSGIMTLRQAVNVIMGANIGTTITAWILSLAGIDSSNIFVKLLKPASFTPVLALVGIMLYMFAKNTKKKDTGMILLGFATLMFGMESMSGAVSGLKNVPAFRNAFIMFKNPVLGVAAGAALTAIIQSSSASVGILQAFAVTGQISYGAAIPIVMGQNIGTCITAMLSSVGATKNAKRAALVHLSFNVIGTVVWLSVFGIVKLVFNPVILDEPASLLGIAVAHSVFNILCTLLMLPLSGFLEVLVGKLVPDENTPEAPAELDKRLLMTPSIALERCHKVAEEMADTAVNALKEALLTLHSYTPQLDEEIRRKEEQTDHYEDILGTYLVDLSTRQISEADSREAAKLLKLIGDFERISDHSVNIMEAAEEMYKKGQEFTEAAASELDVLSAALTEILNLALEAFIDNDLNAASKVEPLEQVIDKLKEKMRINHIYRMQQGDCTIDVGFVWADLLTDMERTADHCSNIAGCIIDMAHNNLNLHESLRRVKNDSGEFDKMYEEYAKAYRITGENVS